MASAATPSFPGRVGSQNSSSTKPGTPVPSPPSRSTFLISKPSNSPTTTSPVRFPTRSSTSPVSLASSSPETPSQDPYPLPSGQCLLDNNNLNASVPTSFNRLSRLKRLELQQNNISSKLPDLTSLKNLNYLDVSDNRFSGPVPSSLPGSLVQISMRNNLFQGTIPKSFRNLTSLEVIDLSHNELSGSVPSFIFTHQTLQQLTLSFNGFTSLDSPRYSPSGLPSELISVDLSNNKIRGPLPLFMGLLPKLSALSLENNSFFGMVPTQYVWKTVSPAGFQRLLLGGNFLFGVVPGPLMALKPGSVNVQLAGNCFSWCPGTFFFCRGREQRSLTECRKFSRVIP